MRLDESCQAYVASLEPCPSCGRVDEMDNIEGKLLCAACSLDEMAEDDWECTHCGGEGLCWDGSDPLGDCPDDLHHCHACGGSGKRSDQTFF